MKPPPFDYSSPETLEEALDLLREIGDEARPLAGGQSLIPLLSLRLARPAHLIDLGRVSSLAGVRVDDGHVVVGAMTREHVCERSPEVRERVPVLAAALPYIGHPAIRSRGTVGGSIAHADPAAELPAVAVAIGAEMVAESRERGRRVIPAADFFEGFFTTALQPDEILVEIRLPAAAPHSGASVMEVARRHGDFAMVGAVCTLRLLEGRIAEPRIVLTGVSGTPLRAVEAEAVLEGAEPTAEVFEAAAAATTAVLEPPADLHASSAYRRHIAGVLIRKALREAAGRAEVAA